MAGLAAGMGRDSPAFETVRVECACGRDHVVEGTDVLLDCECGRSFALSVTELSAPDDDPVDDSCG